MSENGERAKAPKISHAIQDRIGKELREVYAELLRQPLPDNLIAPLRSSDDTTGPERRLQQAHTETAPAQPDALPEAKIA